MLERIRATVSRMSAGIMKMLSNGHITIRKGMPADARDFAELVLLSSPTLFPALYGDDVGDLMRRMYSRPRNLFSHDHTYFAELSGKRVGMLLVYSWQSKKRQDLRTGLLLLREMKLRFIFRLPTFLKARNAIGMLNEGEYYISNLATYTSYQSTGIGTKLIHEAEKQAREEGAVKVTLDVEVENANAIKLYRKLGFGTNRESSLRLRGGKLFEFHRMSKHL
jgi:ribosomal protein S18 acetylase RimI-like enzyme